MNTNQLARLQHTFQDCVLHPGTPDATAWISASGRAAPDIQLSIYTHAYGARLREVLASDYPAMHIAVGDDFFYMLADNYIEAYPSHYYSLRDFGRHVPDFVAGLIRHDERYQDMPWLHELAVFEWTLGQAFDAANTEIFTAQDMVAIPPDAWPALRFVIHPSVQRLDLEWNVPGIWQALTADEPVPVSAVRDGPGPWLIWREQLVTRFRSMHMDEQRAFDVLREGACFNDMCELLATLMGEEDVPLYAAGLLKGWIDQGLISGIR